MIKDILRKIKSLLVRVVYNLTGICLLRRTQWYRNMFVDYDYQIYPGNVWYREHDERNFNIVALGSSGAKWAFDFESTGIKGMNWANQPQTLQEDYNLLRHYHSILHKGGIVIITIMPFTGLNKTTGLMDAIKYVRLDYQGEAIQPHMYKQACRYAKYPILFGKTAIKAFLRYLLGKELKEDNYALAQMESNPMTTDQLEADALRFIKGWKSQFGIVEFEAPLSKQNQEGRNYRINLMRDLIDFCSERGYKAVYVIPPVTKHLSKYYTPKFEDIYIYNFLKQVNRNIPLLDYGKVSELQDDKLYFNSFFLNKTGRKLFTRQVLTDLDIL